MDSPSREKKLRSNKELKEIKSSMDSERPINLVGKEEEAQLIKEEE